MERTLKYYLDETNRFHKKMMSGTIMLDPREIKMMLNRIAFNIRQIQSVSHRMAYIYNVSQRRMSQVSYQIKDEIKQLKYETYPKQDDWRQLQKAPGKSKKKVAPGVEMNVEVVDDLNDIPDTPLYWVNSLQQFALSINGTVLRGNIGNVYEKNTALGMFNIKECRNYEKCMMKKRRCKYFHDPLKLKKMEAEMKDPIRNFTNNSWLFTTSPKNAKNTNLRHIGNRNTLGNDLYLMRYDKTYPDEVSTRFYQTMHDLLILLTLDQYNLLEVPIVEEPD